MYDEELLYYSLKRVASTIERIINSSMAIDDSPKVDWEGAMDIRDIIAHLYFDIDESIVFDVVKNKLSGMLQTINKND